MSIEDAMYMKLKGLSKDDYEPAIAPHKCCLCEKVDRGYRKAHINLPDMDDEELFICKECYDELE